MALGLVLIKDFYCMDIFQPESGEKKTTIRVKLQKDDSTLEESEIESIRARIIDNVKRSAGGKIAE